MTVRPIVLHHLAMRLACVAAVVDRQAGARPLDILYLAVGDRHYNLRCGADTIYNLTGSYGSLK